VARCRTCGHDNPEPARYCAHCGAPLPAVGGEARERKLVTVLFCDLVDFTARFDRADPEDVRAALSPYHARVRREIERFGGTVEKFIGDAVVGVFGAPVAHEDDARRAVWSALRIPPVIEDLNESEPELELAVRIGIDTGQAVVTREGAREGQGIVTGDVVNTASRIQTLAPVGGVIVGDATHRLTQDMFDFERLEPMRVKGKARPLSLWRVSAARSRFGADPERPSSTPFIGREDELEVLKRTFARAVRKPSVQLVTLMGEPGVGKSRLLREFFSHIDDLPELVFWRQGRCLPYGEGVTFWALGEIVKAQAGILESDGPEEASTKLSAATMTLVPDAVEREWLTGRVAPLVGLAAPDGGADRDESFSAWRRFLEAMASVHPLVVVVEDLHWAHPALLEFVEHVADWSTDVPMVVLCTARPELYERHPGWGGGKRNFTAISLPPLADEQAADLVSSLLRRAALPEEGTAALLERAGGNPLFAEELVRMRRDLAEGSLPASDQSPGEETGAALPETLQALIAARLDTLPGHLKSLLQDASVMGKVFWSGALSAIGDVDALAVEEELHELTLRELVRPARVSSVRDQVEYSFWHLLIRDVAYGEMPRAARAEKHREMAAWMEGLAGDRVADHAELLAHHYGRALAFARMSGMRAELPSLEAQARRYLEMAGDRAMALEVTQAEAFFRQALDLAPPGLEERPALLAKAAEAAAHSGRLEEAQRDYEEAVAGFRAQGRAVGEGDAMVRLSNLLWQRGDVARCRSLLAEALGLLEREAPGPELANCYAEIATDRMVLGDPGEAREWADRALELAGRVGADAIVPRALSFRGMALCYLGDFRGTEDVRAALDIALEQSLSREAARIHAILTEVLWADDGPAAALEASSAGADLAERRGVTDMAAWCRCSGCGPLFEMGRWEELLEVAGTLVEWSRSRGGGYIGVMAEPWMAQVFLLRGETDRALDLVNGFLPLAREIGDPQVLVQALVSGALAEEARGSPERALALVEEVGRAEVGIDWYRGHHLVDLVRLCLSAGRMPLARALVDGTAVTATRRRISVLTCRAALADAEGDRAGAGPLWESAAAEWGSYGHVLERAQALLGAGRCLRQADPDRSAALLREAGTTFAQFGATRLLEESHAALVAVETPT
jgi:class 3 adenylate cyclase/tetratricopeptide (TPR) repeat protein